MASPSSVAVKTTATSPGGGVGEAEGEEVGVAEVVAVGVGEADGEAVGVGVGVGEAEGVADGDGVPPGVPVGGQGLSTVPLPSGSIKKSPTPFLKCLSL